MDTEPTDSVAAQSTSPTRTPSDSVAGDAVIGRDAGLLGERLSLREQVARAVRAALVAGRMQPGVVYSAPALATRFGVSATPVREALLDLAKDGLVEPVRNKGFRVRSMTAADLDDIHRLRELLEIPTVGSLARDGCAAELPRLRALADDIADAVSRADVVDYVDADDRFHAHLLGLAGNARLVRVVAELRAQARLYGPRPLAENSDPGGIGAAHHHLLDHIAARDPDAAQELTRRHLAWSRLGPAAPRTDPASPERP
ncbi:GntR family transcriptional regulator [Streptomyces sp. SID3343]|uniref:GntR family transcriptional regulator n=1 Tax=Streptomyces sp. SID3343 TaxID=2690260 RepID=UPI00136A4E91|nr:GntR family transcriptional regulator [Streptomyces sp. SID3343]MYW06454.1 FCD domain-containing protein [Streptomyces sp. SID3343]